MSDPETPEKNEPKLVVDSDWKEQVAREKEAAAADDDDNDEGQTTVDISASDAAASAADLGELPPPPPASFDILVSMLFTQALAALGQMPDPSGGEMKVNKPYAKHFIDTIEMLGEKTKGNLSDNETKMLSETLHALRMAYVNVRA